MGNTPPSRQSPGADLPPSAQVVRPASSLVSRLEAILNDWNIGRGFWSAAADAGSAQALAKSAGAAQTAFTGWFLPTGNGSAGAGALNQYLSIWSDVGSSLVGLQAQFDGVRPNAFWSGTEYAPNPGDAWNFNTNKGNQNNDDRNNALYAVAVRPGESVPFGPAWLHCLACTR